ncbi:MAG: hypothetical protein GY697_27555 [Desulfobacterales bacterium]|nr:hypothetical protein [Desulfobacterales bacterium]
MAKQDKIQLLSRPLFAGYTPKKFKEFTIDIQQEKVSVGLQFKKPQEVSKAQIKRLQTIADQIFLAFEKKLITGVQDVEKGIQKSLSQAHVKALVKRNSTIYEKAVAAAEKEVTGLNVMIRKAILGCEAETGTALKKRIAGDKNLRQLNTEFKIIVAFKATKGVVGIGVSVTGIVVSGGVNVAAWGKAVKGVVDLAKLINNAVKKEPKLRADMLKAVEEFTVAWNKNAGVATGFFAIFKKSKKKAKAAAGKTKRYKVEVGSILKKVNAFSGKIDAVTAEANKTMKQAKVLEEPWRSKVIAQAVMIQRTVVMEMTPEMDKMIRNLDEKEAFCTQIETYLISKKAIDNFITSFQGQIKSFKDAPKFITPAMAVAGLATSTKKLVEGIIELA